MNNQNASLAKEIEDLINKSIEANKVFLNESSKLVRKAITPGEKTASNLFGANFLTDAFTAYTKLNIQHMKNMLDLGVSLIKQTNTQTSTAAEENTETGPAFILKGEVEEGSKISMSFLLDNIKQESVVCDLVNTSYTLQSDSSTVENFNTNFSPQSFLLNTGEQKRITIDIEVPQNTKAGVYSANVQVKGFEPAYFSILLTVKEIPNKTATNARKTTKKSQ
jgi:hypothetical protein